MTLFEGIISVCTIGTLALGVRSSFKLEQVHKTTNSLAQRNEAIAKQLGVVEGEKRADARNDINQSKV